MSKKFKSPLKRDNTLRSIEDDLDGALERLEGTNRKVQELLGSFREDAPDDSGGPAPGTQATEAAGAETQEAERPQPEKTEP